MEEFQRTQLAFASHIRDPQQHPAPEGLEDRRMAIYRELMFNNLLGFLTNGFPVLSAIYSQQAWQRLARRFFAKHPCQSPYFVHIADEFLAFVCAEENLTADDFPFVPELAHYEWLELSLSVREAKPCAPMAPGTVQLSPLAEVVSYHYPVHLIGPDCIPQQPLEQPVFLVVYRDSKHNVAFMLVNQVTAHLLAQIQQQPASLDALVKLMQLALPQLNQEDVARSTQETLDKLLHQGILSLH